MLFTHRVKQRRYNDDGGTIVGVLVMKMLYALPIILAGSLATSGVASAQVFSYQKQWWPNAATMPNGENLGSGEAYAYAGPSGRDLWNDPRAWWPDYNQNSGAPSKRYVPGRAHR
jgi:hypothetical protein